MFIPESYEQSETFYKGFAMDDLFLKNTSGIQTSRDFLVIDSKYSDLITRLKQFIDKEKSTDEVRNEFFAKSSSTKYEKGDTRGWKINHVRPILQEIDIEGVVKKISYRPFDMQFIGYTDLLVDWTREKVQKHMLQNNISITIGRQGQATGDNPWNLIFIQDTISDLNLFYRGGGIVCPLYLYPEPTEQQTTGNEQQTRTPNLNPEILSKIEESLQLTFVPEKETDGNVCMANSEEVRDDFKTTFAPIDLLDYIYAVLHSPEYREKYKEFLKIDFPRVPYPQDSEKFWQLVKLGGELRQLHLMESPRVEQYITRHPEDGDNIITRKITKTSPGYEPVSETHGKVWINDRQYFDKVPLVAWEFYIGGYQPAQKWLKDRKGRGLSYEDILHYQKIIVALTETERLMREIDSKQLAINNDQLAVKK